MAVNALLVPTGRLVGFACKVTVKGAPGLKTTEAKPERPPLVAVMCAVPARVEEIVEVARPLIVERGVSTLPRSVANVTEVPSSTVLLY